MVDVSKRSTFSKSVCCIFIIHLCCASFVTSVQLSELPSDNNNAASITFETNGVSENVMVVYPVEPEIKKEAAYESQGFFSDIKDKIKDTIDKIVPIVNTIDTLIALKKNVTNDQGTDAPELNETTTVYATTEFIESTTLIPDTKETKPLYKVISDLLSKLTESELKQVYNGLFDDQSPTQNTEESTSTITYDSTQTELYTSTESSTQMDMTTSFELDANDKVSLMKVVDFILNRYADSDRMNDSNTLENIKRELINTLEKIANIENDEMLTSTTEEITTTYSAEQSKDDYLENSLEASDNNVILDLREKGRSKIDEILTLLKELNIDLENQIQSTTTSQPESIQTTEAVIIDETTTVDTVSETQSELDILKETLRKVLSQALLENKDLLIPLQNALNEVRDRSSFEENFTTTSQPPTTTTETTITSTIESEKNETDVKNKLVLDVLKERLRELLRAKFSEDDIFKPLKEALEQVQIEATTSNDLTTVITSTEFPTSTEILTSTIGSTTEETTTVSNLIEQNIVPEIKSELELLKERLRELLNDALLKENDLLQPLKDVLNNVEKNKTALAQEEIASTTEIMTTTTYEPTEETTIFTTTNAPTDPTTIGSSQPTENNLFKVLENSIDKILAEVLDSVNLNASTIKPVNDKVESSSVQPNNIADKVEEELVEKIQSTLNGTFESISNLTKNIDTILKNYTNNKIPDTIKETDSNAIDQNNSINTENRIGSDNEMIRATTYRPRFGRKRPLLNRGTPRTRLPQSEDSKIITVPLPTQFSTFATGDYSHQAVTEDFRERARRILEKIKTDIDEEEKKKEQSKPYPINRIQPPTTAGPLIQSIKPNRYQQNQYYNSRPEIRPVYNQQYTPNTYQQSYTQKPFKPYEDRINGAQMPQRGNIRYKNVVPLLEDEREFDGKGNYKYSYVSANGISANEEGHLKTFDSGESGEVARGGFSWTDANGKVYKVEYTADENGFHPVGDHLPTPPPIPPAIARSLYRRTSTTDRPAFVYRGSRKYKRGSY